mmetsp:Transcript_2147/g.5048  ORF Transcript_2147/g.5048 Transcript_2147/m.5048 type:complete len:422 (-) Transcript_2147:164-1429(-)
MRGFTQQIRQVLLLLSLMAEQTFQIQSVPFPSDAYLQLKIPSPRLAFESSVDSFPKQLSAIRNRIEPALMGFQNVVSAVPPCLENLGSKLEGGLNQAKAHIDSATAAFAALPVQEVITKFHQGGLAGLADVQERGKALFGLQKDDVGAEATVVGSVAETSLPGFADGRVVNIAPLSNNIETDNLELTQSILNAFAMDGWEEFAHKHGVKVWRRGSEDLQLGHYAEGVGPKSEGNIARFLCVRAAGKVDAPVDDVYQLFLTNDYVMRYNSICQECLDLGWLDRSTKLTWSSSKRMGPILSRDFVTRCHYRKLRDGSVVMATMSEQLPCKEQRKSGHSSKYCRMEITFAGYLLRPLQDGTQTEFNMISLANPGGVLDSPFGARLTNWLCATGPVSMVKSIREILLEQEAARPAPSSEPQLQPA